MEFALRNFFCLWKQFWLNIMFVQDRKQNKITIVFLWKELKEAMLQFANKKMQPTSISM